MLLQAILVQSERYKYPLLSLQILIISNSFKNNHLQAISTTTLKLSTTTFSKLDLATTAFYSATESDSTPKEKDGFESSAPLSFSQPQHTCTSLSHIRHESQRSHSRRPRRLHSYDILRPRPGRNRSSGNRRPQVDRSNQNIRARSRSNRRVSTTRVQTSRGPHATCEDAHW